MTLTISEVLLYVCLVDVVHFVYYTVTYLKLKNNNQYWIPLKRDKMDFCRPIIFVIIFVGVNYINP
jgi:hypothetical protein